MVNWMAVSGIDECQRDELNVIDYSELFPSESGPFKPKLASSLKGDLEGVKTGGDTFSVSYMEIPKITNYGGDDISEVWLSKYDEGIASDSGDIRLFSNRNGSYVSKVLVVENDKGLRKLISLSNRDVSQSLNSKNLESCLVNLNNLVGDYGVGEANHNLRVGYSLGKFYELLSEYLDSNGLGLGRLKSEVEVEEFLGMNEDSLVCAGIVHDIGKLFVPRKILSKAGALTKSEFEQIKLHTGYGHKILSDLFPNSYAADIARYHHENWDGVGSYTGLSGQDIPLVARMAKIVDVYDALREERSYKRGYNPQRIYDMFSGVSDSFDTKGGFPGQFDPELLEFFLNDSVFKRFSEYHDVLMNKYK